MAFKRITLLFLIFQGAIFCFLGMLESQAAESVISTGELKKIVKQLNDNEIAAKNLLPTLDEKLALAQSSNIEDEKKNKDIEKIVTAKEQLLQTSSSIENTRNYIATLSTGKDQLKQTEKQLSTTSKEKFYSFDEKTTVTELNVLFNELTSQLENQRNIRQELDAHSDAMNNRREKIADEISMLRKRLEANTQQAILQSSTVEEKSTDIGKSTLIESEKIFVKQKLLELEWEQRSFDIRRDLLRIKRQIAEKLLLKHEQKFNELQQALNNARAKTAADVIEAAEKTKVLLNDAHPILEKLIEQNQQIANETANISDRIASHSNQKQKIEQTLDKYQHIFNVIKEKISQAGLTDAIGLKLRNEKNQLPDITRLSKEINQHRDELNLVQLRRIELEDRMLELVDINLEIERFLASGMTLSDEQKKAMYENLFNVLVEQKERFLPELMNIYDVFFERTLFPLLEREREYYSLIQNFSEFIDEKVLWIQSADPLGKKDIRALFEAVAWLINPTSWLDVLSITLHKLKSYSFISVSFLLAFIILLISRQKLKKQLAHFGRYKTKLSKARFIDSLYAAVITVLLAGIWPLFLWFIAFILSLTNEHSENTFSHAISVALFATANLFFVITLLLSICRKNGLAEVHFRWREENITLIKRQLLWFAPISIPLVFIFQATNHQPLQAYFDSLGRVSFIILMMFVAALIFKFVNLKNGLFSDIIEESKDGWLDKLSVIWLPVVVALPILFAGSAALGYMYTAHELMIRLIDSWWVIILAIFIRGFFIRGLNIAQRKLTMEQLRRKIMLQQEESNEPISAATGELKAMEEEIDVTHISSQSLRLLNNAIGFSIIIGLYLLWYDILPALRVFDEVTLWVSDSKTPDGQLVQNVVTLTNALTVLLIILITSLIGLNIPGLLEIAILQKLPFTPSGRYAITTIVSYIIIIIGIVLAFNAIGIGWSKIQWLAAAITLGLGFGLQEIFANFVSGLIILFERQIRVGDTVTVSNISGKVARIKMRATTITDWDRKELIIPNKEFVTGQVINWSLTDTILRLVIPIGIAYGSDTEKTTKLLLDIANRNDSVLDDPNPVAIFTQLGDSTLNFELRVFLGTPDCLISTRHELLMEIDKQFKLSNIEIAFPQRDIHIRSMPMNMNTAME